MTMVMSVDPRSGGAIEPVAPTTTADEVRARCEGALAAGEELASIGRAGRARVLRAMAEALRERSGALVSLADRETALGEARLTGELTRTAFQLDFFAEVVDDGAYLEATIDHPGPTPMGPRPDLRRMLVPLGPVAVFGASNFPFAFSVPGGDTASALAAGCAVVAKAHDAHPATSVACAEALAAGAAAAGVEAPLVQLVFGERAGVDLVRDEAVRAVGFTGSLHGGRALARVAQERPSPIPFYGELGALNAFVVCPEAAAARGAEVGRGLAASFTLGVGQFCTKPGIAFVPRGAGGDELVRALADAVREAAPQVMLSERIADAYRAGSATRSALDGVTTLAGERSGAGSGCWAAPLVLACETADLDGALLEECFGPIVIACSYRDLDELRAGLSRLTPGLTGTVHADDADAPFASAVLGDLSRRVGRLVWNGYPTGVAVAWAMHHGGPFPAATDPLHSSVGASSIRRFLRPVSFQGLPEALLPSELVDLPAREHRVPRRVDGVLEVPE